MLKCRRFARCTSVKHTKFLSATAPSLLLTPLFCLLAQFAINLLKGPVVISWSENTRLLTNVNTQYVLKSLPLQSRSMQRQKQLFNYLQFKRIYFKFNLSYRFYAVRREAQQTTLFNTIHQIELTNGFQHT